MKNVELTVNDRNMKSDRNSVCECTAGFCQEIKMGCDSGIITIYIWLKLDDYRSVE